MEKEIKTIIQKKDDSVQTEQLEDTLPPEIGGRRKGLEPTRYGDWEQNGRCVDF
jgi:hypothetical protein